MAGRAASSSASSLAAGVGCPLPFGALGKIGISEDGPRTSSKKGHKVSRHRRMAFGRTEGRRYIAGSLGRFVGHGHVLFNLQHCGFHIRHVCFYSQPGRFHRDHGCLHPNCAFFHLGFEHDHAGFHAPELILQLARGSSDIVMGRHGAVHVESVAGRSSRRVCGLNEIFPERGSKREFFFRNDPGLHNGICVLARVWER